MADDTPNLNPEEQTAANSQLGYTQAIKYARDLARVYAADKAKRQELKIAGLIQQSIQPGVGPNIAHLEFATDWKPAYNVGGDAWGWVMQPSGKLACFLLDVAGKGLPAALAAVSLHTAFKIALRLNLSPIDALRTINEEFYDPYTTAGIMATATVFSIELDTMRIEHANAGHPATLFTQSGRWERWPATMPPIGVLPDSEPILQEASMSPRDFLICASDGFTEIDIGNGVLWGEQGIRSSVTPAMASADLILSTILQSAERVRDGKPVHDDQTILTVCCVKQNKQFFFS